MELNRDLYIDGVSDYLEQQENLYNSSTDTVNYIINSEGELVSASTWRVTDYIPVTPGSTFYYEGLINTGASPMSAFYDSSKQFISSFKQVQGINNITIPSGASYIRFSLNNSDINLFKYDNRSYYGKYASKDYLEDGKQLFNKDTARDGYGIVKSSGATTAENTQCYSEFIPAEANTSYAFNINFSSNNFGVTFYNSSKTYLSGLSYNEIGNGKTFTTPANTAYIIMTIKIANKDTFMLNKGTSALPYEEYYEKYLNKGDGILIPYTLYDNSSGSTGNITLSDNVGNYKYIEIYYTDETNAILFQKTYNNSAILFISRFSSDGANFQNSRTIELSQNTITTTRYGRVVITSSGSVSVSSTNNIKIVRVIGYK